MTTIRSAEREQFLADIVTCVAEDGCTNDWRQVVAYKWVDLPDVEHYVTVVDVEDREGGHATFKFDIEAAATGLRKIITGTVHANTTITGECASADRENDAGYIDAYSADCILQAAWFGELVYG